MKVANLMRCLSMANDLETVIFLLFFQQSLKLAQHHRLAAATIPQSAMSRPSWRPADVLHQRLVVGGFIIARLVKWPRQPVILHHFNLYAVLLFYPGNSP